MTKRKILPINHIEAKPVTGTPRIAGKGVLVYYIAHLIKDPEWPLEKICQEYDLTPGQVYAALSYYEDHKEELEQKHREIEERLDRMFAENPELDAPRQRLLARRAAREAEKSGES